MSNPSQGNNGRSRAPRKAGFAQEGIFSPLNLLA